MEPGRKGIVTAMSIVMKAEVYRLGQGKIRGELFSKYLEGPFGFVDYFQMINKMEEIFDANGFPQAFLSPRSFKGGKGGINKIKVERNDNKMNFESINETDGNKCTFEVTVRFRQNATWQGQILWAEKNMRQNFRSVLEMLKLMDEALSEGSSKQEVDWNEKSE